MFDHASSSMSLAAMYSLRFSWQPFFQSTSEYVQSISSTRIVDSYHIDLEWKKGVEASILLLKDGQDSTLRVLKELLSKLDPGTTMQPLLVRASSVHDVSRVPNPPTYSESVCMDTISPKETSKFLM